MNDIKFARTITSDTFCKEVEGLVRQHKMNYIDAVVYVCEKNNVEIEAAASMIRSNHKIKALIQNEGEELNCLPRTAKLPI